MRVSIAYPCHDTVASAFAYDLAALMMYTTAQMPEDWEIGVNMVTGTYVHSAREKLLLDLMRMDVDYILWLDADMRFPRDTFFRLLEHDKDVVGCNYSKRTVQSDFVAIEELDWENRCSTRLETNADSTGLVPVDALGFGCVLMKTHKLYDALPDLNDEPWFWFERHPGQLGIIGEDVFFCRILKEAGIDIFVDQDLSKEIRHIGQFEFECRHAEAVRAANRRKEEESKIEVVRS